MTVKKEYEINDQVWICGINRKSNKLTKGKIVYKFNLPGYDGIKYIIAVPTEIEDLLEIRTWESISEDEFGPLGLFREITDFDSSKKFLSNLGFDDYEDLGDPTADEIHAAIEKSLTNNTHKPLVLKDSKNRVRRRFGRKKL